MAPEACQNQSISDIRATDEEANQNSEPDVSFVAEPDADRTPREVIILGLYNTGTNMMNDLIRKNLEKPNDVQLCKNFTAGAYCGGVWKHTHPNRLGELSAELGNLRGAINLGDFKEAVAVVMVRHPFSLMRSIQAANYDMDCHPNLTSPGWLKRPCFYHPRPKALEAQEGMPRLFKPTCFDLASYPCWTSIVSAWNSYTFGYLYEIQNLFHKVVFVRYEDVISDPSPALEQIAFSANVHMPRDVEAVLEPSKKLHGFDSNDNGAALMKVKSEDYMSHYSDDELQDICGQLNLPLLYTLGYAGCRPVDHTITKVMDPNANVEMSNDGRPMYSTEDEKQS